MEVRRRTSRLLRAGAEHRPPPPFPTLPCRSPCLSVLSVSPWLPLPFPAVLDRVGPRPYTSVHVPRWRNWQTHRTQNPARLNPSCGFDSRPRHQMTTPAAPPRAPLSGWVAASARCPQGGEGWVLRAATGAGLFGAQERGDPSPPWPGGARSASSMHRAGCCVGSRRRTCGVAIGLEAGGPGCATHRQVGGDDVRADGAGAMQPVTGFTAPRRCANMLCSWYTGRSQPTGGRLARWVTSGSRTKDLVWCRIAVLRPSRP